MKCTHCQAEFESSELETPKRGELAKAILTDWRVWVFAFLVMGVSAFAMNLANMPSAGPVVGGALTGMAIAVRMGRLRGCPRCHAMISAEATRPV